MNETNGLSLWEEVEYSVPEIRQSHSKWNLHIGLRSESVSHIARSVRLGLRQSLLSVQCPSDVAEIRFRLQTRVVFQR